MDFTPIADAGLYDSHCYNRPLTLNLIVTETPQRAVGLVYMAGEELERKAGLPVPMKWYPLVFKNVNRAG